MAKKESRTNHQVDVGAIKKRFLLLNKDRLRRAQDSMRTNQRDFLDFLPLLFHINYPRFPGYVAKEVPAGICDYVPSEETYAAANRYINRFENKKRAMARYDILSMFLMGSSGTVAYSRKSDFDIWLCHRHGLTLEQLGDLQAKATAIEEWANGLGLEVHFFLMDAEDFKQGKIVDLSSESSGTAQYYLLLEEFYRTSLLLAGRYPAWWLVPVEQEANYEGYLKDLYKSRLVSEDECIDFGGIPTIPAEEFFGAALWQLFKGIDSPYKSVLKLLLMEVYASEYPNIELLCHRFKRTVYAGDAELDRLDPYLMLYRRLEEYLLKRNEPERLELMRRCFYFKVNQKLGDSSPYDWRRDLLRAMTNVWGWEQEYLALLDDRSDWKIRQVLKERQVLVKELTYTYRFLSDFGRNYTQLAAINQRDLNTLGRKLYAAFERKTGKVEIVNRGISQNVREEMLTLYQIRQGEHNGGWALLAGEGEGNDLSNMVALKRGRHVIEVLAWAYFNGLLQVSTTIKVVHHDSFLGAQEVEESIRELERVLPAEKALATSVEDLCKAVHTLQAVALINLGCESPIKDLRPNRHLASGRIDAFSYGGMHENLVKSFDLILMNSWKEVITHHYEGTENILGGLCSYFKLMPPSKGVAPPVPKVLCHSSNHRTAIQQRIERFCADVVECFYGAKERLGNRYIAHLGRAYYILYFEDDTLRYQCVPSYGDVLHYLSKGRQTYSQVIVDHYALQETLLPLIFKFNKPGVVQLFYRENGTTADIYVLDENGSLFQQETGFFDSKLLLGHFRRFFDSVLQRQYYQLAGAGSDPSGEVTVEYYQIARDRQGNQRVVRREANKACERRGYLNVQVIAGQEGESQPSFTIYCEEQEFSSVEYGSNLFKEVARYIIRQRRGGQGYPIFITDLDLPPAMFGDYPGGRAPTADFLNYKKSIEIKLNEALQNLNGPGSVVPLRVN